MLSAVTFATWWYWDAWRWTGTFWEPLGNRMEYTTIPDAKNIGMTMAKQHFPEASLNRCYKYDNGWWLECDTT